MADGDPEPSPNPHPKPPSAWKGILVAVLLASITLVGTFLYTLVWPPFLAVESWSMQHGNHRSQIGTMDTGDLVFVKSAFSRDDVVTYVEGRITGYTTYGDYGDVILFQEPNWGPDADPGGTFLHRAMAYVHWNVTAGGYDIPDLANLDPSSWAATDAQGRTTSDPRGLGSLTLRNVGWRRDAVVLVNLTFLAGRFPIDGFLTLGDNNVYNYPWSQHDPWIVSDDELIAVARGEIPWFGLLRLTLFPGEGCCERWFSTDLRRGAPLDSWISLHLFLPLLLLGPPVLVRSLRGLSSVRRGGGTTLAHGNEVTIEEGEGDNKGDSGTVSGSGVDGLGRTQP
jgi:signal peptidase